MRTLVLGSEGFIGKPFCQYLNSIGRDVTGIDLKHGKDEDLRYMILDLNGVDSVYFLAWDVGGSKYIYGKDTQLFQLNWNLELLSNVMPQLQDLSIPFVFTSSQLAAKPDISYGVTKRLGEIWTNLIGGSCVRLWNVYGSLEEPSERSHVVSDLVYSAVRTGKIELLTVGFEKRQFVHIDDVCRALYMSMRLTGIHDITNCKWISILNLARIISKETGTEIIQGSDRKLTAYSPYTNPIPNWFPTVTLEQGLRRMINEAMSE